MRTTRYFLFDIIIFILLLFSCGTHEKEKIAHVDKEVPPPPIVKAEPTDFSKIAYELPKSTFVYDVKIEDIQTTIVKKVFTAETEEYEIPKDKEDGYLLTIKYSITNPYNKEMMAPIPDYYWISSANGEFFSSLTTGHRDCECQIANQHELTTLDNIEVSKLAEGTCGFGDYCLRFKPNETKIFLVKFRNPIHWKIKELMFHSFGLKSQGERFTRETDMPLIIDIEKNAVVGVRNF